MTGNKYHFGLKAIAHYFFSHQIRYMRWWRKTKKHNNPIFKIILKQYSKKYGLEISTNAKIGAGLYLGHPYNITVARDTVIGKNVNLHKGCTIGRENRGKREGSPKIGDRISIGINSTIVDNIVIGNDVMIASNSFVNFDVPNHSIVVGNPGVIYRKDNATDKYIGFTV